MAIVAIGPRQIGKPNFYSILFLFNFIEKCKKRLNLLRAIRGYGWGACKKTLLTIYRTLIRSILDYGDVAYSSACKSYLDKLSCIRLCCRAPRGTAQCTISSSKRMWRVASSFEATSKL